MHRSARIRVRGRTAADKVDALRTSSSGTVSGRRPAVAVLKAAVDRDLPVDRHKNNGRYGQEARPPKRAKSSSLGIDRQAASTVLSLIRRIDEEAVDLRIAHTFGRDAKPVQAFGERRSSTGPACTVRRGRPAQPHDLRVGGLRGHLVETRITTAATSVASGPGPDHRQPPQASAPTRAPDDVPDARSGPRRLGRGAAHSIGAVCLFADSVLGERVPVTCKAPWPRLSVSGPPPDATGRARLRDLVCACVAPCCARIPRSCRGQGDA